MKDSKRNEFKIGDVLVSEEAPKTSLKCVAVINDNFVTFEVKIVSFNKTAKVTINQHVLIGSSWVLKG